MRKPSTKAEATFNSNTPEATFNSNKPTATHQQRDVYGQSARRDARQWFYGQSPDNRADAKASKEG
jgi:hypothetical protein